jgi:hypothetical protein
MLLLLLLLLLLLFLPLFRFSSLLTVFTPYHTLSCIGSSESVAPTLGRSDNDVTFGNVNKDHQASKAAALHNPLSYTFYIVIHFILLCK